MNIFATIGLFVWYAIATIILVVIVLMVARLILNKADLNPFSRPVIMIRRWTDPMVNPVRRPVVQMGFSPNVAPLVVILVAILLGYFASEFIGKVLVTVSGLIASVAARAPISFVGYLIFGTLAIYSLMIFARIIISWGASAHNRLLHFLIRATEPILAPFRRIIPPLGMIDISPIVVLFLLDLLQRAVAVTLL
ncbi:MAG: YggT family protein [Acidobacteriota bacterium]|jgi:YggT family protein|nr:YggT family protein [Acidobacteriota bacterium]